MNEIITHLFPDEDKYKMFSYLEEGIVNLKKSNDWLMTLLLYMNAAIRLGGFQLEVNRCVLCGGKNRIVAFSFIEGGFICQDCFHDECDHDLSKTQMLLLREIVNSKDYSLLEKEYNHEDAKVLFDKFITFMEEAFGYHFKNIRLLID